MADTSERSPTGILRDDGGVDEPLLAGMDISNVANRRSADGTKGLDRRPYPENNSLFSTTPPPPPSSTAAPTSSALSVTVPPPPPPEEEKPHRSPRTQNTSTLPPLSYLGLGLEMDVGREMMGLGGHTEGERRIGDASVNPNAASASAAAAAGPTATSSRLSSAPVATMPSGAPFLVLTSGAGRSGGPGNALVDGPPRTPVRTEVNDGFARYPQQQQLRVQNDQQAQQQLPRPRASDSSGSDSLPASSSSFSAASTSLSASASGAPLLTSRPSTSASASPAIPATPPPPFTSPFGPRGSRPTTAPATPPHMHNTYNQNSLPRAGSRGSMILYRLSAGDDLAASYGSNGPGTGQRSPGTGPRGRASPGPGHVYAPPAPAWHRNSGGYSSSEPGDSVFLEGDTKYPSLNVTPRGSVLGFSIMPGAHALPTLGAGPAPLYGHPLKGGQAPELGALDGVAMGMRVGSAELGTLGRSQGGLVAYVWDPEDDEDEDEDEDPAEKWIHDPSTVNPLYASQAGAAKSGKAGARPAGGAAHGAQSVYTPPRSVSLRGVMNVTTLSALILGLLALFIIFPIYKTYSDNGVAFKILSNTRINATGQAVSRRELEGGWVVEFVRDADP